MQKITFPAKSAGLYVNVETGVRIVRGEFLTWMIQHPEITGGYVTVTVESKLPDARAYARSYVSERARLEIAEAYDEAVAFYSKSSEAEEARFRAAAAEFSRWPRRVADVAAAHAEAVSEQADRNRAAMRYRRPEI